MTAANRIFVDTNILVYSSAVQSPFHCSSREIMMNLAEGGTTFCLNRQVLREYFSVLTRSTFAEPPTPIASVIEDIRRFGKNFFIAEEDSLVTEKLLSLMATFSFRGKQVHDANIVATMLRHDITTLLTHNISDFERFSSLIKIIPLKS